LSAAIAACVLPVARAKARPKDVLFSGPGPIELSAGPTHIQLLGAIDEQRLRGNRIHLRLDALTARRACGIAYGVYLNGIRCAGTLRFGGGAQSLSFDATALLRDLERAGPLRGRIVVSLIPDGVPDPHATPRIGGLSLVTV
jgi:hypothetical protein